MPSINIYLPDEVYDYIARKAHNTSSKTAALAAEIIKEQVKSELAIPERLRRKT